jgi:hypothetical protein
MTASALPFITYSCVEITLMLPAKKQEFCFFGCQRETETRLT